MGRGIAPASTRTPSYQGNGARPTPPAHATHATHATHASVVGGQKGAIAVIFALVLIPIIGMCALALDLAMVYNRKAEMHNLARLVAISAARKLNGTVAGIDGAVSDAASTASVTKFKNATAAIAWSSTALRFSDSPDRDGNWLDAAGAAAVATKIFYVRVDTSRLSDMGVVNTALASLLSETFATVQVDSEAIAGRTGVAITPLAICAMSGTPAAQRENTGLPNELVEYGFRRGVSYDLMNLNPNDTSPLNFVVNPLSMPGSPGNASDFATSTVGPYACSGTLGIPGIAGGTLAVARPFPLAQLFNHLNSRFDLYEGGACTANGAPPDYNIKSYNYADMVTPLGWLNTAVDGQTAAKSDSGGRLATVADLPFPGGTAAQTGPLWAYARAVAYSTYAARPVEPVNGYATMTVAAWPLLYNGQVARSSYPASSPYMASNGVNVLRPGAAHAPGIRNRRVLNVPLLDCSTVPSSSARVVAVGKFFMTKPATDTVLAAEFAGTLPLERIPGFTGLFE